MEIVHGILVILLLASWSRIGISFLITAIQSIIYDRRREKREIEREKEILSITVKE